MEIKVDKNALNNFIAKLKNISYVDKIADELANEGLEIAQREYGNYNVDLSIENEGEGQRTIVASGEGLSYIEFGTGLVGQGTYKGNLPTEIRTFESPKNRKPPAMQSTQGWEYNYKNDLTKRGNGWYYNKEFTTGKIAQAQMFNTATELRRRVKAICKRVIGEK